ncbi:methyltransferase type 11 [Leptodontidium sp. 2 PMI_412]|nr:methyltransferase type 11 [Leptodontidium sp. 2 PMI_412]
MTYQSRLINGDDPAITKLYGERTALTSCKYLLPYVKPNSNILDVGCGPGIITSNLAKLAPQGRTTGVDNSTGIIEEARKAFPTSAVPNLKFVTGDCNNLSEFADNSFDIVHAHQLLCHLPDPVPAMKEFYRICKPGGLVAARDSSPSIVLSLKPDLPAIRQYWVRAMAIMEKTGGHIDAGLKLEGWAREAGFGSDGGNIVTSVNSVYYPSHLSRVTGEPAEQAAKLGLATKEEMDGWAEAWREWEATEGAEFVFEAGEVLCWKGN